MRAWPGIRQGTISLLLIITVTTLFTHRAESTPKQRLHRAYEPAAIQLDINLQQETLSLFLAINPEAARAISNQPIDSFTNQLSQFAPLITLPEEAQCQQTQKQFLEETTENPVNPQLTGYLEYQCQNPESLDWLRFHGFKAMPGLKHTSVWLITDHWQNKQQLDKNQEHILLQKKQGFTHFLLNLFD